MVHLIGTSTTFFICSSGANNKSDQKSGHCYLLCNFRNLRNWIL